MGGVTVDSSSSVAECHGLKSLAQVETLDQLALDASALTSQTANLVLQQQQSSANFSIADFLVPGLQPKVWEDWQVADELDPFANGVNAINAMNDFSSSPFQFGCLDMLGTTLWDTTTGTTSMISGGLPADQAYDEMVFELTPSHFETPATVNIADLIVGPSSAAPSVSPLELTTLSMPDNYNDYNDLALANLYGFTEENESDESGSDMGSDLSDAESLSSGDESDDLDDNDIDDDSESISDTDNDDYDEQQNMIMIHHGDMPNITQNIDAKMDAPPRPPLKKRSEDPNKRRMEEALVARINNDLGPEHMGGLFKILKGNHGQSDIDEDEDEEMEVDLSCLDEATLVELYQYVETCCMQTMRSLLVAEEQERKRAAAAAAKAAAKAEQEKQIIHERERSMGMRTPALSPSHSMSSASPSPPHPSTWANLSVDGYGGGSSKKRSVDESSPCAIYYEHSGTEELTEARWMTAQHKTKRKRGNVNGPVCMGGGGTGKGRRKKTMVHEPMHLGQKLEKEEEDEEEIGEDDEIDVVGF